MVFCNKNSVINRASMSLLTKVYSNLYKKIIAIWKLTLYFFQAK